MFLYFTCLRTYSYLVLSDTEEKLLGLGEPFVNFKQQVLYHVLLEYMQHHEKVGFMQVLKDLRPSFIPSDHAEKLSPDIMIVKEKIVRDILVKFDLGEYDPEMLKLSSKFDAKVLYHLEMLFSNDMDVIEASAKKEIAIYEEADRILNMHLGFVSLAYITHVFKIVWFQHDRYKWIYSTDCKLVTVVAEHVRSIATDCEYVFPLNDDLHLTNHSITFRNILDVIPNRKVVVDWLKENKLKFGGLYCCYSQSDIYNALVLDTSEQFESSDFFYQLKSNKSLAACHNIIEHLRIGNMVRARNFQTRGFLKYELSDYGNFCRTEFDDWHIKALNKEMFSLAFDHYSDIWRKFGRMMTTV